MLRHRTREAMSLFGHLYIAQVEIVILEGLRKNSNVPNGVLLL